VDNRRQQTQVFRNDSEAVELSKTRSLSGKLQVSRSLRESKGELKPDLKKEKEPAKISENDDEIVINTKGHFLVVTELTTDKILFRDPKNMERIVHSVRIDEIRNWHMKKMGFVVHFEVRYELSGVQEGFEILSENSDMIAKCVGNEVKKICKRYDELFEAYSKDIGQNGSRTFSGMAFSLTDGDATRQVSLTINKLCVLILNENGDAILAVSWKPNERNDVHVISHYGCLETRFTLDYREAGSTYEKPVMKAVYLDSSQCPDMYRVFNFTFQYVLEEKKKEEKLEKKKSKK